MLKSRKTNSTELNSPCPVYSVVFVVLLLALLSVVYLVLGPVFLGVTQAAERSKHTNAENPRKIARPRIASRDALDIDEDGLSSPSGDNLASKNKSEIYQFAGVTVKGKMLLRRCSRFSKCTSHHGIYGYALDEYTMVDYKHKILMEFTPKAACTSAVVSFLEAMGFKEGIHYNGWPHTFRDNFYDLRCGTGTPCMYFHPGWFRFKIVRNPFDRAVSSYLYVLKMPFLIEMIPRTLLNASFENFIDYQLSLPVHELQYFATRHAGLQSTYYERFVYQENQKLSNKSLTNPEKDNNSLLFPPIFQEIIKAEDNKAAFDRIYDLTNIHFEMKSITKHYQLRDEQVKSFVGNLSWPELQQLGVPQDYGLFYNPSLREKVQRLFHWDLLLYNYSFPFTMKG